MSNQIKFGLGGVFMPPPELNAEAARGYEAAGLDFIAWWDQLCMTFPRSIWTPDIVPAAETYDIDCYMDAYALMTQAAMVTEKIELGIVATDTLRRAPNVLAQSFLTIDHIAKGRAFFTLGAGEVKQFAPYSLPRNKPFAHLEEAIRIIRALWESREPVTYEGPIWNIDRGILAFEPYEGRCPPLLVAAGPGRGIEIAGKHADGWITFLPPCGDPEWFAEQVATVRRHAAEAGRDPEALTFGAALCSIIAPTEDEVDTATQNLALRWDAAALVPGPSGWGQFGAENPLGKDWSYPRDLIPMHWSREDALAIAEQVTPEMVRKLRFSGTPQSFADQLQPYIDAGLNMLLVGNYAELVLSGDWGDAMAGQNVVAEAYDIIRDRNGQTVSV